MDPLLYHTHHTLRSDDLSFWRELAAASGGPVLELGCGTGRVLLRLLKDQIPVAGIDNDPQMLDFLRGLLPPTLANQAEVVEADMRAFDLGRAFPLVILPGNTLSTFPGFERKQIFTAVRKHLQPDGAFVFSIPNPLILSDLEEVGEEELEDEFSHPATGDPIQVFSSWEMSNGRVTFYWRYEHQHPDGRVVETRHETTHVLDAPQVYLSELKQAGLKPFAVYGDFLRETYTPDSPYFISFARIG